MKIDFSFLFVSKFSDFIFSSLIRIAISTIAYERRLFPSDFFRDSSSFVFFVVQLFKSLSAIFTGVLAGTNIKALNPEDENSKLLVSWLEDGVFEGLGNNFH